MKDFNVKISSEHFKTLRPEYISWLKEYVRKNKFFSANRNSCMYKAALSNDQQNISRIFEFFMLVASSHIKREIEIVSYTKGVTELFVTINLDEEITIEMITSIGHGSETKVFLAAPGTGQVNLKDVYRDYEL